MDRNLRALILAKCSPLVEEFKKAIAEEPGKWSTPQMIDAGLAWIEATMRPTTDPEVLAMMMIELREAARASHQAPGTVQ
jgi:hypothetical protein